MVKLTINIVRVKPNAILPEYQSEHASGMDLHACLDAPVTLQSLERAMIPTGLAIELPPGYESQVRARSGLSIKHGITMINGIGTIDSDFRGEYCILVVNLGKEPFTIEPNMRIAQLVIARYEHVVLNEVKSISQTKRGDGAYGSTDPDIPLLT